MPMRRSDYPADWLQLSREIRFQRAKGRCEQVLRDGTRCPAKNRMIVHRSVVDPERFRECPVADPSCTGADTDSWREAEGRAYRPKITQITLTCAHLCACRPICGTREHILAMCQYHHMQQDARQHVDTRRMSRAERDRYKAAQAGQRPLEVIG